MAAGNGSKAPVTVPTDLPQNILMYYSREERRGEERLCPNIWLQC